MDFDFSIISDQAKNIAIVTASLATFLTACGVIWLKGLRPIIRHGQKVGKMFGDVEEILAEVNPNGGSSLRDSVNRIEDTLLTVSGTQSAINQDAPQGIFRCTVMGENLEVNRTYCRMLGATKEQLMGYGWRSYVSPKQRKGYDDEWQQAFLEGRDIDINLMFVNPTTKNRVDVLIKSYPIKVDGNPYQIVGVVELVKA